MQEGCSRQQSNAVAVQKPQADGVTGCKEQAPSVSGSLGLDGGVPCLSFQVSASLRVEIGKGSGLAVVESHYVGRRLERQSGLF